MKVSLKNKKVCVELTALEVSRLTMVLSEFEQFFSDANAYRKEVSFSERFRDKLNMADEICQLTKNSSEGTENPE